ncbi:hypothetical protein BCV72DRAFT_211654, partial [Rhizopus microsporus var. microsporus]
LSQVICQFEICHSLRVDHHNDPVLGFLDIGSVYDALICTTYNHASFYLFWGPCTTYSKLRLLQCFYPLLLYVASTHKWRSFGVYSLCISIFSLY